MIVQLAILVIMIILGSVWNWIRIRLYWWL